MTSITWAGPRCVQEPDTILAPQNRTQGSCVRNSEARCWAYLAPLFIDISCLLYEVSKFCGEYISLFWRRRSVLSKVVFH